MIKRVTFHNFKAFRHFTLHLGRHAVIVGPNNAGKSTITRSLRAAALMLQHARSRKPVRSQRHGSAWYHVYDLDPERFGFKDENLRYEFTQEDTWFEIAFEGGALFRAVWPVDDDEGFFFLRFSGDRAQPKTPKQIRDHFPTIGVVPPLTPVDGHEAIRAPETVRRNLSTRLASRHFRNQLLLLSEGEWEKQEMSLEDFLHFAHDRLSVVEIDRVTRRAGEVDLHYREGRVPKEIDWAGDGIQVFLQMLFHIYRLQGSNTMVLDEPELYLHADLQRRVIQVVQSVSSQTILATHSHEIMAETPAEYVVWVDKSKSHAIRAPSEIAMGELSSAMGSRFNLRLAKALTANLVLFVEGDDMTILRRLAKRIGATEIASEANVAVVPIGGFANWRGLKAFRWIGEDFLKQSVAGYLILDHDYHSEDEIERVKAELNPAAIETHVWGRKALESYLLVPKTIARTTGVDEEVVAEILKDEAERLKDYVLSRMISMRTRERTDRGQDLATVAESCLKEFQREWVDRGRAVELCDPKELFSALNRRLQALGTHPTSPPRVAQAMRADEVPPDMKVVLRRLDDLASGGGELSAAYSR